MELRTSIKDSTIATEQYVESLVQYAQRKYPAQHHFYRKKHTASLVEGGSVSDAFSVYEQEERLCANTRTLGTVEQEWRQRKNEITITLNETRFSKDDFTPIVFNAKQWSTAANMCRADLHMHGLIGFQDYWRERQGYANKNVLEELFNECHKKKITVCAVTSQEKDIPRCSVHDRLGWLREHEAPRLPREYQTDILGENILVVSNTNHTTYFINGQTVNVVEGSHRYDHLIIGTNQVPNGRTLKDTIAYGKEHGLIQIAEHPCLRKHYGIGHRKLLENLADFDAIEGFNAQAYFWRSANAKAKYLAHRYRAPWIATSDAHNIQDLGVSHIQFPRFPDVKSESIFFASLKEMLRQNQFRRHETYSSLSRFCAWTFTFLWSIHFDKKHLTNESKE